MARCMAALSKLSYCNLMPGQARIAIKASCGMVCKWAGLGLEPGSRLLGADRGGENQVDYGFVVKFTREEEANQDSLPEKGCIVVFRPPSDAETTVGDMSKLVQAQQPDPAAPQAGDVTPIFSPGAPLPQPIALPSGTIGSKHRLEVWESDAVCEKCMVSARLKSVWEELRQRVLDHLEDAECKPGSSVFVTGHSDGGALAILAMFSLQAQSGYKVEGSYNFESPRVGNKAFAAAFQKLFVNPAPLFRITHGADRVPRMPEGKKFGFSHVGYQVWYQDSSDATHDFIVCGNTTADPKCGVEGLLRNETCPTDQSACPNSTCAAVCTGFAPKGGPHCQHPLAPAKSFCDFAGNSTENWGSEYNEVVQDAQASDTAWEKTCSWGSALVPKPQEVVIATPEPTQPPTTQTDAPKKPKAADEGKHHPPEKPVTDKVPAPVEITVDIPIKVSNDSCFQADVAYQPLDIKGHYFSTEADAYACQLRCGGIEGCTHFSFFPRRAANAAEIGSGPTGDCHVSGDASHAQNGSIGFISGPHSCHPEPVKSSKQQYLDMLGNIGNMTHDDVLVGARRCTTGFAALGVLFAYFGCMYWLASDARRPADARSAAAPAVRIPNDQPEVGTAMLSDASVDAQFVRRRQEGDDGV